MKTNHDGTVTLNAYDTWISCAACGQRVTGDSIHTCSPQLKELTDEDLEIITEALLMVGFMDDFINYDLKEKALTILRKAQEK
jgi:hypothetical protein